MHFDEVASLVTLSQSDAHLATVDLKRYTWILEFRRLIEDYKKSNKLVTVARFFCVWPNPFKTFIIPVYKRQASIYNGTSEARK